MNFGQLTDAVKREMNRRRRHGGAEDVPASFWEIGIVSAAIHAAIECARAEDFRGDWDSATLGLEEKMEALANALRKLSQQQALLDRSAGPSESMHGATSYEGHFPGKYDVRTEERSVRPATVRYDAGSQSLSNYLSYYLRHDSTAQYYHERVCGGKYLTREDAWGFLTSPLPKVLSIEDYEKLGLCPVSVRGRLRSKYLRLDGLLFQTHVWRIDVKTKAVTATTETLTSDLRKYDVEISLPVKENKPHFLKRMVLNRSEKAFTYISHQYSLPGPYRIVDIKEGDAYYPPTPAPFFDTAKRYVEGFSASVMGEMIGWAESLCGLYPVSIWDMLEALLTGQFPPLATIQLYPWKIKVERLNSYDEGPIAIKSIPFTAQGPATLRIQPWVTPEVLADAWREHRKTNPAYSPSAKQADALHFVLSHTIPGQEYEWEKLANQWHAERGELMTRGQLCKQFQRARAAILPGYQEE